MAYIEWWARAQEATGAAHHEHRPGRMTLATASHRNGADCGHAALSADILLGGGDPGTLAKTSCRSLDAWGMELVVDRPFVWRAMNPRWQPWNPGRRAWPESRWQVAPESLCTPGVRMILAVSSPTFGQHAVNLAYIDGRGPLLYDTAHDWATDGIPLRDKRAEKLSITAFMVTSDLALMPAENRLTQDYLRACVQRAHSGRGLG